jgi:hypothetical protein
MTHVLPEAYELVEDELMTTDDFRDFVCDNPIRFWGEANPDFFKGTAVEATAAAVLSDAAVTVGQNGQAVQQLSK